MKAKPALTNRPKSERSIDSTSHRERIQEVITDFVIREGKLKEVESLEDIIRRFIAFLDARNFDIIWADDKIIVPVRHCIFRSRLE